MANEGVRGAKLATRQIGRIDEYIAACQVGITLASIGIGAIGEPTIAHYLDKPLGERARARSGRRDRRDPLLPADLGRPHHLRRAVAEDLHGRPPGRSGSPSVASAPVLRRGVQAGDRRPVEGGEPSAAAVRGAHGGAWRGDHHLRGPQVPDRAQRLRGHARPGRGRDASRRLPPARAGGPQRDDADPGGGDRRRVGGRGDRAAALRPIGAHPARRRPRTTTPTASAAPCTTTRWCA